MSKQNRYNPPDVDDTPPPAYQEVATPPFNPNYVTNSHSPPHTPDISYQAPEGSQSLYPQIPIAPIVFPQPQHYTSEQPPSQPQLQQQHYISQQPQPQSQPQRYQPRYQTIEIPYTATTNRRNRRDNDRRRFPLAAVFFLFGWFCPPLWVIGACCCAGSRNEYESFWGKVNFIMAMALIVTSIIYSIIAMSEYIS